MNEIEKLKYKIAWLESQKENLRKVWESPATKKNLEIIDEMLSKLRADLENLPREG